MRNYLQSPGWKDKAAAVKERDGKRCAWCGSPNNLQAHHLTYARAGNEPLSDLVTLCASCHAIATAHQRLVRSEAA